MKIKGHVYVTKNGKGLVFTLAEVKRAAMRHIKFKAKMKTSGIKYMRS